MWNKVKQISKQHPDPIVRKAAKSILAEMNAGKRDYAKISEFVKDFSTNKTNHHDRKKTL